MCFSAPARPNKKKSRTNFMGRRAMKHVSFGPSIVIPFFNSGSDNDIAVQRRGMLSSSSALYGEDDFDWLSCGNYTKGGWAQNHQAQDAPELLSSEASSMSWLSSILRFGDPRRGLSKTRTVSSDQENNYAGNEALSSGPALHAHSIDPTSRPICTPGSAFYGEDEFDRLSGDDTNQRWQGPKARSARGSAEPTPQHYGSVKNKSVESSIAIKLRQAPCLENVQRPHSKSLSAVSSRPTMSAPLPLLGSAESLSKIQGKDSKACNKSFEAIPTACHLDGTNFVSRFERHSWIILENCEFIENVVKIHERPC